MKATLATSMSDISNENEKHGALLNRAFAALASVCNVTFARCEHYITVLGSSQSPA
jgi:hypothetical protein